MAYCITFSYWLFANIPSFYWPQLQNISKEEILTTFIHKKSQKDTMPEIDEACSMEQVKEGQYQDELFSKVLSNISRVKTEQHITDDDIETGFEFFGTNYKSNITKKVKLFL